MLISRITCNIYWVELDVRWLKTKQGVIYLTNFFNYFFFPLSFKTAPAITESLPEKGGIKLKIAN